MWLGGWEGQPHRPAPQGQQQQGGMRSLQCAQAAALQHQHRQWWQSQLYAPPRARAHNPNCPWGGGACPHLPQQAAIALVRDQEAAVVQEEQHAVLAAQVAVAAVSARDGQHHGRQHLRAGVGVGVGRGQASASAVPSSSCSCSCGWQGKRRVVCMTCPLTAEHAAALAAGQGAARCAACLAHHRTLHAPTPRTRARTCTPRLPSPSSPPAGQLPMLARPWCSGHTLTAQSTSRGGMPLVTTAWQARSAWWPALLTALRAAGDAAPLETDTCSITLSPLMSACSAPGGRCSWQSVRPAGVWQAVCGRQCGAGERRARLHAAPPPPLAPAAGPARWRHVRTASWTSCTPLPHASPPPPQASRPPVNRCTASKPSST